MIRKLSTIPLKLLSIISYIRGEIMKFKRACTENPEVQDDWNRDDDGFETLINCNNEKKEVKRY